MGKIGGMIEFLNVKSTFALFYFDLDGTILDFSKKDNSIFIKSLVSFLERSRSNGSFIVFSTGRNKEDAFEAINNYKLPMPDFLIANLGSEIYDKQRHLLLGPMVKFDKNWKPKYVDQLIKRFVEILPRTSKRSTFYKRTFYLSKIKNTESIIKKVRNLLSKNKIRAHIYYTKEKYLYIIPKSFDKKKALMFLVKKLRLLRNDVLVAGDDETDVDFLKSFKNSILVGNATVSLKNEISKKFPHIYISIHSTTQGLIEGIEHFITLRDKNLKGMVKKNVYLLERGKFSKVMKNLRDNKTSKLLERVIFKFIEGETYEKIGYFQKAAKSYFVAQVLAMKIGNRYLSNAAKIQIGRIDISSGQIKRGLVRLKKLSSESSILLNNELFINILNVIGYGYRIAGNRKLARRYINMALVFSKKGSDISNKIRLTILHNKAGLLRELSDYDAALKIYLFLIKQINKNNAFFRARLFNNIGFIFRKQKQYREAQKYYMKAYKLERNINARQLQARTLNNMGGVFRMEGKFIKALACFTESVRIRKQLHDHLGLSSSLLNKGIVLKQMGMKSDGEKYLMQSYIIRKQSKSKHLIKEVSAELQNL